MQTKMVIEGAEFRRRFLSKLILVEPQTMNATIHLTIRLRVFRDGCLYLVPGDLYFSLFMFKQNAPRIQLSQEARCKDGLE